jgi:hypothetical protein
VQSNTLSVLPPMATPGFRLCVIECESAEGTLAVLLIGGREDSAYRSGRSPDWLKMKNSDAPAVKREEEEDWGKRPALIRSSVSAAAKNRPPKGEGGQDSEV